MLTVLKREHVKVPQIKHVASFYSIYTNGDFTTFPMIQCNGNRKYKAELCEGKQSC